MGARRGVGAALAAALVLLAACSGADGTGSEEPSASPTSRATTPKDDKTAATVPAADPDNAVDPPGPRKDRLWSADVLVQWDKPLTDRTVKQIEKLKGVAHTERIGLGQVSIENRVLTVAS